MKRLATFAFVLLALASPAQDRPVPVKIPIADGIVLFMTPPYGDVGLDGNSIAILSRDGVFVFDTNGTPAAAAAVLAEVRKLTDRPVRFVVNSLMVKITRDDPALNQAFGVQLVDWYLHRVYDELNGPLRDVIAPIPPK